jgi:regulation of enolase protein 1 (concanavalin A-like superfamily)
VLKAVKYSDWIIDTMVTQRPTTASNDGLMVYLDNDNWIHFGQYFSSSQMVVNGTINGTYSNNLGVSVSSLHDRIRIKKAGNVYTFQYSDDAIAWTTAGSWTDTNGNLAATSNKRQQYGFMASSIGSGTDFDVNFDFFREFMQPNGVVKEVTNASEIAQIIGIGSINAGHDINGADIGNMTEMNGNVYMMFGDNNGTVTAHRPNALAIGTDSTPSNGFTFDSVVDDTNGNAVALISALNQDYVEKTNIPTAGVSVGSSLYYTYMSVYKWKDAPSHWDTNDTRIAVSTNSGQSFSKLTGASDPHWTPDSNFVQFAIAKDPNSVNDFVYFFGSSAGAFGDIKVFRVAEPNIASQSNYKYYTGQDVNGNPVFTTNEQDAVTVVPAPVRNYSIQYSNYLGRWLLMYMNDNTRDIELRDAPHPWGPWSNPITVIDHTSALSKLANGDQSYIYGGYMTPKYMDDTTGDIYFTLTKFANYRVYWDHIKLVK